MRVILDTSVIVASGYTMANTTFQVFLEELERAGHSLYIPRIVYDETRNKYTETLNKQLEILIAAATKLGRITNQEAEQFILPINSNELQDRYETLLNIKFGQVNAQILDYPKISHYEIVQRSLNRRKPFDSKGHNGYRDTLIWETVIELAQSDHAETVAFISQNTNDFSASNGKELHPHLLEDIELVKHGHNEVLFFGSLEDFVEQHIISTLEILETIRTQLENGEYPHLKLEDNVLPTILPFFQSADNPKVRKALGFPIEFKEVEFDDITVVYHIQVLDVRKLSTEKLLIDFSALTDPHFKFSIHSSDYHKLSEEEQMSVWPQIDSEGYMEGFIGIEVYVELSIIFDPELNQITSMQTKKINSSTINMYRGKLRDNSS